MSVIAKYFVPIGENLPVTDEVKDIIEMVEFMRKEHPNHYVIDIYDKVKYLYDSMDIEYVFTQCYNHSIYIDPLFDRVKQAEARMRHHKSLCLELDDLYQDLIEEEKNDKREIVLNGIKYQIKRTQKKIARI